jgi:hypothetical protein
MNILDFLKGGAAATISSQIQIAGGVDNNSK